MRGRERMERDVVRGWGQYEEVKRQESEVVKKREKNYT